jgi:Glycosyltransferase 61
MARHFLLWKHMLTLVFLLCWLRSMQFHLQNQQKEPFVLQSSSLSASIETIGALPPPSPPPQSAATMMMMMINTTTAAATTSMVITENQTAPSPNIAATAWCVLDQNNTNKHFKHFPHAMESLSRCWSHFCRVREVPHQSDVQCGFYVKSPLDWSTVGSWTRELVQHMGCSVVTEPPPDLTESLLRFPWTKKPAWFEHPGDVQLLQQTVLQRRERRPREQVDIGIVQRNRKRPNVPSRRFLNVQEIHTALQKTFPLANVTVTDMVGWSMSRQAFYFNNQDVIVLAHGAAVTNAIFMEQAINNSHNMSSSSISTLIEIYPDDYTPYMFQGMMRSCGRDAVKHIVVKHNTSATPRFLNHPRNVDLAPNTTLIVDLVKTALLQVR